MNPLLVAIHLAACAPAQEDGTLNRWARFISFPAVDRPTLVAVELDGHAHRFARPDHSDIRVKTASGAPESLLVRRPTQIRSRLVPAEFQADTVSAWNSAGTRRERI